MAVTVRRSTVIEGGSLKPGLPWVPSRVTCVDGLEYIALSRDDRRLAAFCGVNCSIPHPLRDCVWLTELARARRDAINALKTQALESADVLADNLGAKPSSRNVKAQMDLPQVVIIHMPPLHGDGIDVAGLPMKVLSENGDPKRLVSIELNEANLTYVQAAVKLGEMAGVHPQRTRRTKADRIQPEEGGQVRWNYQRSAPYCVFQDEDGRRRSKHLKPKTEEGIAEAVKGLQEFAATQGRV